MRDIRTVGFDHDPSLDRPLNPRTQQFLLAWKDSPEFHYNLNLNQHLDLERAHPRTREAVLWERGFVDRFFNFQNLGEMVAALDAWVKWSEIDSEIDESSRKLGSNEEMDAGFDEYKRRFGEVPIPHEIKKHQGDLSDDEFRSRAHFDLFQLAKDVSGFINLLEDTGRPTSLRSLFPFQRITGEPAPLKPLEPEAVDKPLIRRHEVEGQHFLSFGENGVPYKDTSPEEIWERWNKIELGERVKYLPFDTQQGQVEVQTGIVQGFDLLGAGDIMFFGPSVSIVGIVVVNDKTKFFDCPLVVEVRLDSEEFAPEDLTGIKIADPVGVTSIDPATGEVREMEMDTMEGAQRILVERLKVVIDELKTEQ